MAEPSADLLAAQAAEWIVRLTADDAAERARARAGFEAWKQADPRHAASAARMEGLIGRVQAVRANAAGNPRPAHAALNAAFAPDRPRNPGARRRRLGAGLAAVCALAVPAWLMLQAYPPAYLAADVRTAAGQWETRTLSDGTRLALNGASAVNLRYDENRRSVELVQGEILVDVARDATRPFLVETAHGSIRALGTRFVVKREDGATVLSMLESRVAVQSAAAPAASREARVVGAGERVRLTPAGIAPSEAIDPRSLADAWQFRQLVVDRHPLPAVLDELDRHRRGRIHHDRAQLEGLVVSAVLPLDDPERALQLLRTSFPQLRMRAVTPYLLLVDAPPAR
ncbi:MAG: FecR domain-containing protein [Rhodocyclales bacterium]|nr:FecR domain-containing protein [Rhodocyclales bacterium]